MEGLHASCEQLSVVDYILVVVVVVERRRGSREMFLYIRGISDGYSGE